MFDVNLHAIVKLKIQTFLKNRRIKYIDDDLHKRENRQNLNQIDKRLTQKQQYVTTPFTKNDLKNLDLKFKKDHNFSTAQSKV